MLTTNAADELLSTTATVGQHGARDTTTYTYDRAGDRVSKRAAGGNKTTLYTYDDAHRLVGVTSREVTAKYAYDGDGVRVSADVGGVVTQEVPDAAGNVLVDGSPATWSDRAGSPWSRSAPPAPSSTSSTTASAARALSPMPGDMWLQSTQTVDGDGKEATPFLCAGQYRDAGTGLYAMRARMYDPATEQFLTRDPLLATQQPYAYAADDPANLTDHTGLAPGTCVSVSGAYIGYASGQACFRRTGNIIQLSFGDTFGIGTPSVPGVSVYSWDGSSYNGVTVGGSCTLFGAGGGVDATSSGTSVSAGSAPGGSAARPMRV